MKKYVKAEKQGAPDVRSYVYNALSDVAFELTQDGYDVNKAEFKKATDNFMAKFFAEESSFASSGGLVTDDDIVNAIDYFCEKYGEPEDDYNYDDEVEFRVPGEKMADIIFNILFDEEDLSDEELTIVTDGLWDDVDKFYDYLIRECNNHGVYVTY